MIPITMSENKNSNKDWWKYTHPDNWWGPFYFNKNDKRLFIWGRRFGIGWTLNFGHHNAILAILVFIAIIFLISYIRIPTSN